MTFVFHMRLILDLSFSHILFVSSIHVMNLINIYFPRKSVYWLIPYGGGSVTAIRLLRSATSIVRSIKSQKNGSFFVNPWTAEFCDISLTRFMDSSRYAFEIVIRHHCPRMSGSTWLFQIQELWVSTLNLSFFVKSWRIDAI